MRLYKLSIALLLVLGIATLPAHADNLASQRLAYVAAEKALQHGQTALYTTLKLTLTDYPLYPYLEYAELTRTLPQQSSQNIEDFILKYPDAVVSDRLRDRWLNYLSKHSRWAEYLQFYEQDWSTIRHCHYLHAMVENGQAETAYPEIEDMWLHPKSRPDSCNPAFKALASAGRISNELTWQRISLAMSKGQLQLAQYLARSLSVQDRRWVNDWMRAHKQPTSVMDKKTFATKHPYRDTILSHGIKRQARKDALQAAKNWATLKQRYKISPLIIMLTERTLALSMFRSTKPEAYTYLTQYSACNHDTRVQEVRLLAALIHRDWKHIPAWIEALPEELGNSERWQYWHARALAENGEQQSASALFKSLAKNRSYYGFLSADRANVPYSLNNRETPVSEKAAREISANPAVQRAQEFIALGRSLSARREWYRAIGSMPRSQLLAASKLAQSLQWYDQAIFTLARTNYWEDLGLRFPLEHRTLVETAAKKYDLDPAWIYGVIRQESAFNASVRSSAGAIGLMQLMPATAREVSIKMLNQAAPNQNQLKQPEKNIKLGTTYLNHVLNRLKRNPVLATAAYNAGPHRVLRWLPAKAMPADIWIELIPFTETRNYVKRVMEYSVIYNKLLGLDTVKVTTRMPDVAKK